MGAGTGAGEHDRSHQPWGHSRGGASCFKQANRLYRAGLRYPVRIFAMDPVPGCMGKLNSHMYVDLELNDHSNNVVEVMIMLAECERRKTFQPVLVRPVIRGDKPDTFRWELDAGQPLRDSGTNRPRRRFALPRLRHRQAVP